jgi:hypothetical protein
MEGEMKTEEALRPTGKAVDKREPGYYIAEDEEGRLYWYERKTGRKCHPVIASDIFRNAWQPYHELKEIRPEKAGELWQRTDGEYFHTNIVNGNIRFCGDVGRVDSSLIKYVIHGKNGWKRLHPKPEDDSVERIEIKKVTFGRIEGANGAKYMSIISTSCEAPSLEIFNDKSMKATFEIPKAD